MDLTTRFNILKTENNMLPVLERMAQYAAPDKRGRVLRLLASFDQDMAKQRDAIDGEIHGKSSAS